VLNITVPVFELGRLCGNGRFRNVRKRFGKSLEIYFRSCI